jgi:hypothetical protein
MQETEALFEIRDAPWQLASIEKLAAHQRPDPAFRPQLPALQRFGLKTDKIDLNL